MLGVVINVLVSWCFALFGTFNRGQLEVRTETKQPAPATIYVLDGWDVRTWHWWAGPGIRRDLVSEAIWVGSTLGLTMDGRRQWTVVHISTGWPMHSLTWWDSHSQSPPSNAPWFKRAWLMGIDVGLKAPPAPASGWGRASVQPRLPIRPIWQGFLINTLLYACLGYASLWTYRMLLRRHRAKRSLCMACGYSVVGLSICSECGTPSPSRN